MDTEEQLVKEMVLASVRKCIVCGHRYGSEDIEIVGHHDECWFLSMVCEHCQTQGLVAAMVGDSGPAEIVTDFVEEEEGLIGEEPVTVEDVLDMHEFLDTFDGDFRHLFAERDL